MDLRLLGPVEASVDDHPVAIGAGKPRALLAMLALHEGSAVSAESLIDGLWGEAPPATAPKMVQIYVSQLRKAFKVSGNGAEIVTRGHGYELRLGAGEVDARRFERLVADGEPREALALWRGPPLDDVATEPFAGLEIRRLEELHLIAIEQALEQDLAAGRHAEAIPEIQALLAHEPLREHLHGLRMLALYRSGRQADALGAYRRARDELVTAIGVEPGPELRRLHEAILRQDPSLDLPLPAELPPELEAGTPLVGRDAELDALREHWRRAKAGDGAEVVLAGVGGIGKTRLAAELAAEVHRDGGLVLYASGAGSPEAARRGHRAGAGHAAPDAAGAGRRRAERVAVAGRPLLVLATTADSSTATLTLGPLDAAAVETIALEYGDDLPVERLVEESGGVPRRVHAAARRWARDDATRRLGATADRAAGERARLRAAEDDLAAGVVEVQAARERVEPDWDPVTCPFKGLASFDVDDADVFFGRERLVAEMVARLAGAPLLGIVGPSGSGKSSALKAGLLPALQHGVLPGSGGWAIALLRPGAHPVAALERALADAAPDGRLVIAVDQFEELFTACRDEAERAAFADALVAAVRDPRRRALVLIALRADFYGRCASYPELWRMLGANHVPVGPMRRDELRRAIVLPAQRAGLRVDEALVDALVADVQGEPGALPLLSTALLELWQERDGQRLAFPAYDRAGGVQGAVARLAERVYARARPRRAGSRARDPRPPRRRRRGRGRRAAPPAARRARAGGARQARRRPARDRQRRGGGGRARGAAARVAAAAGAGSRRTPRAGACTTTSASPPREWDARGRDPGELYRGARLAAALDWSAAHDPELGDAERAFLDESRAASGRSQRRLRAVLAGVGALLVLAVLAGLVALEQRGTARDRATAADAQRLGSRALAENDLDRSLLLARQGVALDDSPQTRGSLLAALIKSPAAIGVMRGVGERMTAVALSPDGRTLAAGDAAGNVFLFDTRTRRRVKAPDVHPGDWAIVQLAYSPDGRRLAVAHNSNDGDVVTLVDTRTGRVGPRLDLNDYQRAITGLRFQGDAAARRGQRPGQQRGVPARPTVERFDLGSGRRVLGPLTLGRRQSSPLLGSSDGRRVLTISDDQLVWRDATTLEPVGRVAVGLREGSVIALAPDDRTAAVGDADGSLRFVDLQDRQRAQGVGPASRSGDRRALHAGRPLARHDERRRRRDRVGRGRRCGVRDAATATPTGSPRCRSAATPARSTRPGSTARSSCGTSPARAGSAGRSIPGRPTGPCPRSALTAGGWPSATRAVRSASWISLGRISAGRSPSSRIVATCPASASCPAAGSRSCWDSTSSSRSSTPTPVAPFASPSTATTPRRLRPRHARRER